MKPQSSSYFVALLTFFTTTNDFVVWVSSSSNRHTWQKCFWVNLSSQLGIWLRFTSLVYDWYHLDSSDVLEKYVTFKHGIFILVDRCRFYPGDFCRCGRCICRVNSLEIWTMV